MVNDFLVGGDVSVDNEVLLMTDFVNLKIKPAQSFKCAHKDRVCIRMFIEVITYMCISIYMCTVFLKKVGLEVQFDNKRLVSLHYCRFYPFVGKIVSAIYICNMEFQQGSHVLESCDPFFL
jgi:hypothetical protein